MTKHFFSLFHHALMHIIILITAFKAFQVNLYKGYGRQFDPNFICLQLVQIKYQNVHDVRAQGNFLFDIIMF